MERVITLGDCLADHKMSHFANLNKTIQNFQAYFPSVNILDYNVDDAVIYLRELRFTTSKNETDLLMNLVCLDSVLISLLKIQRYLSSFPNTHTMVHDWIPSEQDILTLDINQYTLPREISQALDIPYLSSNSSTQIWPINGKIYGINKRILFSIPVTGRNKTVNAHFVFDTGAPLTFIAPSVFDALGIPDVSVYSEVIQINGIKYSNFYISYIREDNNQDQKRIEGTNILGMDFLTSISAKLTMNFLTNHIEMYQ